MSALSSASTMRAPNVGAKRRSHGRQSRSNRASACMSGRDVPTPAASAAPLRRTRSCDRSSARGGGAGCTLLRRQMRAPSGMRTRNVVPRAELAVDVDRSAVQLRPAPAPARGRCRSLRACGPASPSTRWNRSNRRGSSVGGDADAGVARPRAAPRRARRAGARRSRPASVNLNAFESRLRTIFSHMSRSTYTRLVERRAVDAEREAGPLRSPSGTCWRGRASARPDRSARTLACTRPASMREKSSSELTSRSRRRALRCTSSRRSRAACGRLRVGDRCRAAGPSISVSGVRNSWLTFEKNAVLARSSSASASARRRSALVGLRVADRRRDLAGDQIEERAVVVVERPARADAGDEETGEAVSGALERQQQRALRRGRARRRRRCRRRARGRSLSLRSCLVAPAARRSATASPHRSDKRCAAAPPSIVARRRIATRCAIAVARAGTAPRTARRADTARARRRRAGRLPRRVSTPAERARRDRSARAGVARRSTRSVTSVTTHSIPATRLSSS